MPTKVAMILAIGVLVVAGATPGRAEVVWHAGDDRPIAEPALDDGGDHVWRDGTWAMTVYPARKVLDPFVAVPALATSLHVAAPREAADVNALDEVPDSTWFTNRHALHRWSATAVGRGPRRGQPPAPTGPLVVLSGKPAGMTVGFVVGDAKGDRYVLKFDPPDYPEVPTGAEMVCTAILHALGWNVPENYLVRLEPRRFVIADGAWLRDAHGTRRALTDAALRAMLARVGTLPDGRLRAVASRWLPGTPKGGFRTLGTRADDPNDVVPHEDRRELRGLRVVAAWINYTDARRGNFLDAFVRDPARDDGRGHLVHYLLDFSSALGAGNDDWKPRRYGHEYFFDPAYALMRVVTFGLVEPAWEHVPLAHPALGYFDADTFDPEKWRTTYPNPLFDAATARDDFWGAKLVSAFTDADLAVVARAGEWSDPRAADVLADLLRRRQRAIARAYFDGRRVTPVDGFVVDREGGVGFRDLAVESGVVAGSAARYRWRAVDDHRRPEGDRSRPTNGAWTVEAGPRLPPPLAPGAFEIESTYDGGADWSPPVRVTLVRAPDALTVAAIARATR